MKYTISLKIADKTYEGKGKTLLEAMNNMPRPEKLTYKGSLTISNGQTERTQALTIPRLKRLFFLSPTMREIQAKALEAGF